MASNRLTPKIPRGWDDLSADQKRVYENLVGIINQPPSVVDEQYDAIPDSFGGRVIGTDAGRELSEEYKSGWGGCAALLAGYLRPGIGVRARSILTEIEKPPSANPKRRRVLVMTAGGPASGKTSVVSSAFALPLPGSSLPPDPSSPRAKLSASEDGTADLIMDQNLGKHARAIDQIELALANDWDVRVVYVFKSFPLAAATVVDRANRHGRWSPVSVAGHAHMTAQDSVLKLYDRYQNAEKNAHPRVLVELMESLYTEENPVPCAKMSVDDIRPGGKCYLGDKEECMKEQMEEAMQKAKASCVIDPRLIAALECGTNPATGK